MLNETDNMSDEELRSNIRRIAETYNVTLTETQVKQLLDLCRSLEKLDPSTIPQRVEDIQSTLEKVSEAKDQVVGFFQTLKNAFQTMKDFFERLASLFGG